MGCSSSKEKKGEFEAIKDKFESYEELQQALRKAGLESSNLVIGIDYTKSNTWTGEKSFDGKCLHEMDPTGFYVNPYQRVITSIGRTLEVFDDDRIIPTFGFGDINTKGTGCFPFFPNRGCAGFQEVLSRYVEITPRIQLSGPTNFAPVIHETIRLVTQERSYHILVIIADGQVSQDKETSAAIVEASRYPISIIVIGVGDGPWESMQRYDDALPKRQFDNFQFVELNKTLREAKVAHADVTLALMALQEVPEQYQLIRKLNLL